LQCVAVCCSAYSDTSQTRNTGFNVL